MGTNYYVHVNECTCCGRHDELHVGKSGRTLQAHIAGQWDAAPTPIGDIRSWADWKRLLSEVPHTSWNEYDEQLTDEQLIEIFESSSPDARRRQYQWMVDHHQPCQYDWLDADGFSVTGVPFS